MGERNAGGLPKGMYKRPSGTYYGAFVDPEGRRVRRALGRDRARAITASRPPSIEPPVRA